ncbi:GntR family transcriptional regulator [Lentzea flava]|uniref:HTH gntR-type domain-containing protein n=1 Tax=Lentzea flava TaxID=103732 RepID=A0ABQ2VHK0_9PSEU|nr:GntR family transcriptional regulator [Lentzea flava]GGU87368.1 hypothetical protein GCM10010178_91500 [Lentzea flava]
MPIDRHSAQPLTVQIADDLKRRIDRDEFPVGTKFPSLRDLSRDYSVAELTVHAAVKDLQREGLLTSASGRGTFVSAKPSDSVADDPELLVSPESFAALRAEVADLRTRLEKLEGQGARVD